MLPLPVMPFVASVTLWACGAAWTLAGRLTGVGIVGRHRKQRQCHQHHGQQSPEAAETADQRTGLMALNAHSTPKCAMIIRKAPCWMSQPKPAHAMACALASKAPIDAAAVPGTRL